MECFNFQKPYIDPQFESLFDRIYPARVFVDNDAFQDCTVVKVDSANKHVILLEMVQILSDLDLVISKSYICFDGGWFMDVFHVTDQSGNKITDKSIILCIEHALCANRGKLKQAPEDCPGRGVRPSQISTKGTALEITTVDKPGLLSEVSAVLAGLGCHVAGAVAWTHKTRAACIFYVEEKVKGGGPITDMAHLTRIQSRLQNVVKVRHQSGEKWSVRLIAPAAVGELHTERRLHQLMLGDADYEMCRSCGGSLGGGFDEPENSLHGKNCFCTVVSIGKCEEKGYSVVNVRSRDRPKLLFDTICALTDMDYVVFHAAIRSSLSIAFQEYYIRHKDGNILTTEDKRHKVEQCLIAGVERRASQGLQVNVSAENRTGLLSDVTRVLRECGLSVLKAEVSVKGEKATGTFYVRGASGQKENCSEIVKMLMKIDASMQVYLTTPPSTDDITSVTSTSIVSRRTSSNSSNSSSSKVMSERPTLLSIGGLIWSRLSSSFVPLKS